MLRLTRGTKGNLGLYSTDQIDMYRKIRKQGRAGDAITLDVLPRGGSGLKIRHMVVQSLDRRDWLRAQTH